MLPGALYMVGSVQQMLLGVGLSRKALGHPGRWVR